MGMYNQLIAAALSIVTDPTSSAPLTTVNKLRAYRDQQGDPALPSWAAAEDEIQEIPQAESDDGTYTVTIRLHGQSPFTTAALDHDDNAATIEAAIDAAAATASIPGFTAGDIAVTGGPIDAAALTLSYTGESVAGARHGLATVASSLTLTAAPVAAPTATVETYGQPGRCVYAVLDALRVIAMTSPPNFGEAGELTAGPNLLNVAPWFIAELAKEAGFQESSDAVRDSILALIPQN